MATKVEWTDEELEVRNELVRLRKLDELVSELGDYQACDTVASINGYDVKLKPAQVGAWAAFAATFAGDVVLTTNAIQRLKPKDERERNAVRLEMQRRERGEQ